MLKCGITLSKNKKIPLPCVLGKPCMPLHALRLLNASRKYDISAQDNSSVTVRLPPNSKTNDLFNSPLQRYFKLLNYHAAAVILEWEMWVKQYQPPFDLKNKTVLDVGAGCGETAWLFFLLGANKVICVEPDKKACALLKKNLRGFPIQVINAPFNLRHLHLKHDFMKMDCEGGEKLLLPYLTEKLKPCVIEVHSQELERAFFFKGFNPFYRAGKNVWLVKNYA